jgi:hypothetical protein
VEGLRFHSPPQSQWEVLEEDDEGCGEDGDEEEHSGELAPWTHLQPASRWMGEIWVATLAGGIVLLGTLREGIEGRLLHGLILLRTLRALSRMEGPPLILHPQSNVCQWHQRSRSLVGTEMMMAFLSLCGGKFWD